MEVVLIIGWVVLAAILGAAANERGRGGFAWFLVGVMFSPIIGALLLLAFPIRERPAPLSPDAPRLDQMPSVIAAQEPWPWGRFFVSAFFVAAIGVGSVFAFRWIDADGRIEPLPVSKASAPVSGTPNTQAQRATRIELIGARTNAADITVSNDSDYALREVTIWCAAANAGASTRTLAGPFPPHAKKAVNGVALAFTKAATPRSCELLGLMLAN